MTSYKLYNPPQISFYGNYSEKDKERVTYVTDICAKQIYVHAVGLTTKPVNQVNIEFYDYRTFDMITQKALALTYADKCKIYLPAKLSFNDIFLFSRIISHEIAHAVLGTLYKIKESNNLVHYLENKKIVYKFTVKTHLGKFSLMALDIAYAIYYKDVIMQEIKDTYNGTEYYPYWV